MRVVYMATSVFALPSLEEIHKHYEVVGIVTQSSKKNLIKNFGILNNIEVLELKNIKLQYEEVIKLNPDIIITCAYGQIIPIELLNYPKYGCINIHASLLPKLRGGAPIHRAIMNGDKVSGITIMYMSDKMDEGDIIEQVEVNIGVEDTYKSLHDKLQMIAKNLIIGVLESIFNNKTKVLKQDHNMATYGFNIKREDEKIDFSKSMLEIYNHIRGLSDIPGAYCLFDSKIFKIFKCRIGNNKYKSINGTICNIYKDGIGIKVSDGEIVFEEIQIEGKNRMKVVDFLNGIQDKKNLIGKVLM